ncbi:MAG: HDOD domain-containing protein [Chromatiales bacterium]|jgi:HD-like signal output (HDOD) protein
MSEAAENLDSQNLETLLQGIKIPPQPQIMVDIQMETASPDFDLDNVAKLISRDIGLSGWVLKAVNSSFFGLRNKITSITQAINLLGINSIINIVNAVSIRTTLSNDKIEQLNGFWDNAMDVASASVAISKKLTVVSPDEAYSVGLFHNCGIPLMCMRFENYFETLEQAYAQSRERITEIENNAFSTNHAVLGYYVAKSWKLPAYLCETIAEHHKAEDIFAENRQTDSVKKNLLAVLKIASHLCGSFRALGQQSVDHEFEHIKPVLLKYLGITDLDLDDLRDDLHDLGLIH